jgi:hypothetical protein
MKGFTPLDVIINLVNVDNKFCSVQGGGALYGTWPTNGLYLCLQCFFHMTCCFFNPPGFQLAFQLALLDSLPRFCLRVGPRIKNKLVKMVLKGGKNKYLFSNGL